MTFDDNACIRYLMKEMDPSEEMLFEKRLMEDENLLIEVESLRKVNQRLSDLPEVKPPANLTRKVLRDATVYYKNKQSRRSRAIYLSAAATIIVFFFAGAVFIYEQENNPSADGSSQASVTSTTPAFDLNSESSSNGLAPWVDNDQEIHFTDRFDAERAASFDSIMSISFERLQPVQNLDRRNDRARNLHLTGSQ
jgi:hypothetical protein